MKTIEERALEIYPEKTIQWGNYLEDMNGLSRISYIRGAKEQQKLDIYKAWQWIENTFFSSNSNNIDIWERDFRKAMEE